MFVLCTKLSNHLNKRKGINPATIVPLFIHNHQPVYNMVLLVFIISRDKPGMGKEDMKTNVIFDTRPS